MTSQLTDLEHYMSAAGRGRLTQALVRDLVRDLLERERDAASVGEHVRDWSLQGLGMLRTYLDPGRTLRLHVWDGEFQAPGVSQMHTHPWDMESYVVSGHITNTKFQQEAPGYGYGYSRQTILCGEGGGLEGEPEEVWLTPAVREEIGAGGVYRQTADEIHVSSPEDGTVTVVRRVFGSDRDRAYVFWPKGTEWGSAEPRAATGAEVNSICARALARWA
jgi:hypothetical protein